MAQDSATQTGAAASLAGGSSPRSIFLVSYPKIVFLYPTMLAAIAAGLYVHFAARNVETVGTHVVSLVFLIVFSANLVVLSFDFPRTTSLTLFFFCVALGVAAWTVLRLNPDLVPAIGAWLRRLNPHANSTFYFVIAGFLALIYVGVAISVRFDYWEVRPNELLHHHGILSDLKRFSAPNLRIDKEINDIFEYILLGSGRLILHPTNEPRAIVLENVPFISRKEAEITRMLGALQVRIRREGD